MHRRGEYPEPLFRQKSGFDTIQMQIHSACQAVDRLPEDRILNTEVDALVDYFGEKFEADIPILDREGLVGDQEEAMVEVYDGFDKRHHSVPGVIYRFELPFSGDPKFFQIQPSTHNMNPPRAEVRGNLLCFSLSGRTLSPEKIAKSVDGFVDSVNEYLGWHRKQWSNFPQQLTDNVRAQIEARRERLQNQKGAISQLAQLGIKLKEKPGDARTYVPPTVKQKIKPQLPPMKAAAKPDPTLDQGQYDTILGLLRGAGQSIEHSSTRTRSLDEETLRDMCLVPLNAHFEQASGEAFNYQGKTDILIRYDTGVLFVAEFKLWTGEKAYADAIDQLLSYLSWRDTKTALVIFSRNKGFSSVLDKVRSTTADHSRYISGPVRLDDTCDRYTFSLPQDPDRHITLSVLAFDLGTG